MSAQVVGPEVTSDDRLWALLSYILNPIVPIIALLMEDKKNREFVRYHAVQALTLLGVDLISIFLLIGICLSPLVFVYVIYLAVKAYQGEYVNIPVISDFIKNQGWV